MVNSMTGYGKGEGGGFVVEMRSVNHKFLDLSLKLPKDLLGLEGRLKKALGEKFSRGRLDVYIYRGGEEKPKKNLKLDLDAARQYIGLLTELKDTFDLAGDIDINLLASYGDIVTEEETSEDIDELWAALEGPLGECGDSLEKMRADEGAALADDIVNRTAGIAVNLDEVEKRSPLVVADYAKKLAERVAKLSEGIDLDKDRLHQEVAIYADRADVTEELVRGRSHIRQLTDLLEKGGAVGRKLDFLLQEINREVNTIGSKASDRDIAHRVVEMKAELEKIREQVQNIE